MAEKTYEEKLLSLKKVFGSGPDSDQLNDWTDQLAMLTVEKAWLDHPCTIDLARIARSEIVAISRLLSVGENLTNDQRAGLFAEKRAHLKYLAALDKSPDDGIKNLQALIDDEFSLL